MLTRKEANELGQNVEITDDFVMIQCPECGYMAGPGWDPALDASNKDHDETLADFQYHFCDETAFSYCEDPWDM